MCARSSLNTGSIDTRSIDEALAPECITFRTIRSALRDCDSERDRRGFHGEARLAYVVAKLRAADNADCIKASEFLMQIYSP